MGKCGIRARNHERAGPDFQCVVLLVEKEYVPVIAEAVHVRHQAGLRSCFQGEVEQALPLILRRFETQEHDAFRCGSAVTVPGEMVDFEDRSHRHAGVVPIAYSNQALVTWP